MTRIATKWVPLRHPYDTKRGWRSGPGPTRSGARSKQGKDAGEDTAMCSSAARCEWAPWDSNPARRIKSPVLYQMS